MSKHHPTPTPDCPSTGYTLYIILFILLVIIGSAFLY
ncbi:MULTISPECIES: YjcZ family sporulation protein [Bacillus]|nr:MULTISPECIES: YjcZ family sporulation protein [Bacillus]